MRFHYLDWGTAGRHPILFLHGGGLNAHTWDVVCLMLRRDYHCFALDQRGHGDSEWEPTSDYSHDSQVGDVEGFFAKLQLKRPLADRPFDGRVCRARLRDQTCLDYWRDWCWSTSVPS